MTENNAQTRNEFGRHTLQTLSFSFTAKTDMFNWLLNAVSKQDAFEIVNGISLITLDDIVMDMLEVIGESETISWLCEACEVYSLETVRILRNAKFWSKDEFKTTRTINYVDSQQWERQW